MPTRQPFEARLVASRVMTPYMKELEFERLDGRPSLHRPGQWVDMVLPPKDEDGRIDRKYSYSALADGTPHFRVAVTRLDDGPGSTWLHQAKPGVVVPMNGPAGSFLRDPHSPQATLFIASGTGFAPIRAMIDDALRSTQPGPLWLLLGSRSTEDLPFAEDLERWRTLPTMRLEVSLSRPAPGWTGRTGHVQGHVAELWRALTALHPDAVAYVCGWRRMVWPVKDLLRSELGVDSAHLRVEAFD